MDDDGVPMSVRRAIAELVVSDGLNVSAFCREHGVSRDRFYTIRRRFLAEGEAGLEPRSRAPKRVPNRTSGVVEDLVVSIRKDLTEQGLDAGAETIRWHLLSVGGVACPSVATIWRILVRRGFVVPDPSKRPRSAVRSFAAERANECWQIDATHWDLTGGRTVDIVNVIDDCTRVCVGSVAVASSTTGNDAWEAVVAAAGRWGFPARVLSDNGAPFTSKRFKQNLTAVGIGLGHSRPYHPQTCGKVERFHQTLKRFLAAQPAAPTVAELQRTLDEFVTIYNHQRPHRSLGRRTPADTFANTPKTGPASTPITAATRVHHNTVDKNGYVEIPGPAAISIGAAHAGHTATTIRTGNHAHVFIANQLVRQLVIDPNRRSQPLYDRPGRP